MGVGVLGAGGSLLSQKITDERKAKKKAEVELHPCQAGAALFGGRGRQNRDWPGLHMRRAREHQVRLGNEHVSRVQ